MTSEKLLYRITNINSENSFYRGLTYYKNYVYATNGAAFARVKYDFSKEYKGKTYLYDDSYYDMNKKEFAYINSKIDDYLKNKERDTIDLSQVSDIINRYCSLNEYIDSPIKYIKLGDYLYKIDIIKNVLCIAYDLFLFNGGLSRVGDVNALVIKDSDNLIMCACTNKSITDGYSYIDFKTKKIKNIDYGNILKNIKSDITKLSRDKKKVKSNKEEKTIDKQISVLNEYKEIIDSVLN